MLRVAVLGHTAAMSGAEIALHRMLAAIDRSRFEVVVILFSDGPLVERLRQDDIAVRVLPLDFRAATTERSVRIASSTTLRHGLVTIRFAWALARLLHDMAVDVVHCNTLKADLIGGVAGRLAGTPVVWYLHDRITDDYLPPRTASLIRLAAGLLPARVVANSRTTLQTLRPRRPARCSVAYPGLPDSAFATSVPSLPTAATIGMVGRISPTKGQDVFLRAARLVLADHPLARFRVIGSALFNEQEYERRMHALAAELGIDARVEFVGQVPDVRAELAGLSLLVHASPVPEPFGQVIVEAMAAGVPVIATAAGGVPELAGADGELALLVPPGDDAALAEAMRRTLEDPGAARVRADRALVSVRSRFTADLTATAVSGVWRESAGRSGRREARSHATGRAVDGAPVRA